MGKWMNKIPDKPKGKMDTQTAIKAAYNGTLDRSVLIECKPEYANIWGSSPLWLCPDDVTKEQIRQKHPTDFTLSAKEFFTICEGVANGEDMKAVINAYRLFGGSLEKKGA